MNADKIKEIENPRMSIEEVQTLAQTTFPNQDVWLCKNEDASKWFLVAGDYEDIRAANLFTVTVVAVSEESMKQAEAEMKAAGISKESH